MATAVVLTVLAALFWSAASIVSARREGVRGSPGASVISPSTSAAPPDIPLFEDVFSVTDADSDGRSWFVLDQRAGRIHRFDSSGSLTGRFGRSGRGPGELRSPEALAVHGDTVVVAERTGGLVHLYDVDGEHLSDRVVRGRACRGPGTFDVVSSPTGLVFLTVCLDGGRGLEARLVHETHGGSSRVIATSDATRVNGSSIDPHFVPVLASHEEGVVFGLAGEPCLAILSLEGEERGTVCHGWIGRLPVPAGEREAVDRLRRRAATAGMALAAPDSLPPFDRIFATDRDRLVYRASTAADMDSRRLVRLGDEGVEVTLPLPPAPYVFVDGSTALLGWKDVEGTRIRLVGLPNE